MNLNNAKFIASYGLSSQLPKSEKMEIAFAGKSNVGKSSAINKIFNRKNLARVSAVPGKTATINFYYANEDLNFVDLPGYGYAKVAKSEKERWSELIEGYFQQERKLVLVVQLIDMRHPPSKLDVDMVNYLIECEIPFIVLLTKADKLNKTQTAQRLSQIQEELPCGDQITIVPFSSQKGTGIDEVKNILEEVCKDFKSQTEPVSD